MNCQRARESFPDLLDPRIPTAKSADAGLTEARQHLASCPDCQREYAALSQTLAALDRLPVPAPSPRLRRSFYATLEEEKHSAASVLAASQRGQTQRRRRLFQWILSPVAACALVAAGYFTGARRIAATPPTTVFADADTRREIQELRAKVDRMETMNQLVAASFQKQQQLPASERLNTVLTSATEKNPSDRIISELITSLALDPSANVRLRALDALYPHANQDLVRAGVLASLSREANPLVQVAMIDFLASARDRDARSTLEKMSASEATDINVRAAAKRALAQL